MHMNAIFSSTSEIMITMYCVLISGHIFADIYSISSRVSKQSAGLEYTLVIFHSPLLSVLSVVELFCNSVSALPIVEVIVEVNRSYDISFEPS